MGCCKNLIFFFLRENMNSSVLNCQYHDCWWPGEARGQGNNSHINSFKPVYVGKTTITGSDNGLAPTRRQAIIWTNAGMLLIGPLGINLSEILSKVHTFLFKKMQLKISFATWRPFCPGEDDLMRKVFPFKSQH